MSNEPNRSRILIVDDVPANIKILTDVLRDHYQISYATSGQKALELAESTHPDLILLDIIMPGMDGYAVCGKLKSAARTRDIPVIFITAKNEAQDETKGFNLGAVDYIAKPISPSVVLARVKTHLSLRSAYRELEQQNAALREADKLKMDVERISRHDLKSPLGGIIGFADLILESEDLAKEKTLSFVQIIRDAGFKVLHLINLSMDIFKMEQGTYQLDAKIVDLIPVFRNIHTNMESLIRQYNVSMDILINGSPPAENEKFLVKGEEMLCYSMLSNLIKNALEASTNGAPVTISLQQGNDMVSVAIHNLATVPLEIRPRFFEKYVTSGKKSGTGLGTYSARMMAETQNGSIALKSSEGDGTTVTVHLPVA